MPEETQRAANQAACEPAKQFEEGRSRHNNPHSSSTADGVDNQTPSFEEDNTVRETQDELRQELEKENQELRKIEEELEELEKRNLKRQVEATRKRRQERQVELAHKRVQLASHSQEKRPGYSPTTENTSAAHTHSEARFDNPIVPISQTAVGHSLEYNDNALPDNPVASTSSSGVHASSSYRPIAEAMNSDSLRKLEMLTYYTELDTHGSDKTRSFKDMNLDQLRDLTANEEAECNVGQTKLTGHVHYFIFLKTGVMEDLERAIRQAKGQIPVHTDNPDYTPRLKDLIVMLLKKYERTNSPGDLEEATLRALEMIAATPQDHPDRLARMGDWVKMMFKKYGSTGSRSDLDEAISMARDAGVAIHLDNLGDGGPEIWKFVIPK